MSVFTDTWTPNAQNQYSRNVGFNPKALEIDNFSAFYLYVPDASKYIAPNTIGVVIPLPHYNGQVSVQAVIGNPVYPTIDTGNLNAIVTITATDDENLTYQVGTAFNSTIVNAVSITGTVVISGNVGVTGPVTVNGSVSISGTPTVNATILNASIPVTGTVNATITNASIAVTGSVSISGTPAVTISGTPTVAISGTVNATIAAGTVNVQNVTNGILSAAGSLRYLGNQSLGSTITYTINALERALVIFTPSGAIIGGLTVRSHTTGPVYALQIANPVASGVYIAYVNPAIDTQWDVSFGSSAGTSQGFVCADTGLPLTDIARLGQQIAIDSIPVVPANDIAAPMYDGAAAVHTEMRGSALSGLVVNNRKDLVPAAVNGAANASATLTIPSGGSGKYIYITHLRIVRVATGALAGTAALNISTTNLGGRTWTVGNAMAAGGTQIDMDADFTTPLRGAVSNTACTIVMPAAGANVSWFAAADYYYDTSII